LIRRALHGALGPGVEILLRRLERGVAAQDHLRLAARLAGAARAALPAGWDPAALPALEPGRLVAAAAEETSPCALALQRLALADAAASGPAAGAWDAALEAASAGSRLQARTAGAPPAFAAASVLVAGLRSGALSPAAGCRIAAGLLEGLEPKRWFARDGTAYGAANVLRALIALGADPAGHAEARREIGERLLRHVEVRRAAALRVRACDGVRPWQARLERLRFTLALLDAAQSTGDLRFLNAALKENDRQRRAHARLRPARRVEDALLGLHYAASVTRQERLFGELVP